MSQQIRVIRDGEFRALLDLFMVSDPYPGSEANRCTVASMLNRVAAFHGYKDWVEAYHEFNYTFGDS